MMPCPLLHEYDHETGWDSLPIYLRGKLVFRHVVPCGDLKRHQLDPVCWCRPTIDDEDETMLIHNSADGREEYEQGRRVS